MINMNKATKNLSEEHKAKISKSMKFRWLQRKNKLKGTYNVRTGKPNR